jgi:glycerol-3-phosphate dehydrogenase
LASHRKKVSFSLALSLDIASINALIPLEMHRIHSELPYIEAEIRYAVANEYACTAVDMIARRLRLSFQSVQAARESLDTILKVMAFELKWTREEQAIQREDALNFLQVQMGDGVNRELRDNVNVGFSFLSQSLQSDSLSSLTFATPQVNMTKQEVNRYVKWFHSMDMEKAGFVTVNELRKHLQSASGPAPSGSDQLHALSDEEIHDLLSEMDIHSNGRLELGEFLQLMSALKTGAVCQSSLAKYVEIASKRISVERSGGGV